MSVLRYRAGPGALRLLRERGLCAEVVGAVSAPASGPRWLAMVGLDQALLASGVLDGTGDRQLLVGASAGAWRMLTMACPDPAASHRRLVHGYLGQVFTREDTARTVSDAYRRMWAEILTPDDVEHAAHHPHLDLGVHVARVRGPMAVTAGPRWVQAVGMTLAGGLCVASARAAPLVYERILLSTRSWDDGPRCAGRVVPLTSDNLVDAIMASGTVPLYMEPVDLGLGGACVDGGLGDYHLNQTYVEGDQRLSLFLHFQKPILPAWFDRYRPSRRPSPESTRQVLQVYPSDQFVASLPGGRLPDRGDFLRLMDAPEERMRRWGQAVAASEQLGEQFLDDVATGRIPDLVEPLE
jgi:hypothetical protein